MPAPEKVSTKAIIAALRKWLGNVTAASVELGISRNSLYKRIKLLGLEQHGDIDAVLLPHRLLGMSKGVIKALMSPLTEKGDMSPAARKNVLPSIQGLGAERNLARMNPSAASVEADSPVSRRRPVVRLAPRHIDLLSDAKYDLQAARRQDVTESEILETFIEEEFRPWKERQMAEHQKPEGKP